MATRVSIVIGGGVLPPLACKAVAERGIAVSRGMGPLAGFPRLLGLKAAPFERSPIILGRIAGIQLRSGLRKKPGEECRLLQCENRGLVFGEGPLRRTGIRVNPDWKDLRSHEYQDGILRFTRDPTVLATDNAATVSLFRLPGVHT